MLATCLIVGALVFCKLHALSFHVHYLIAFHHVLPRQYKCEKSVEPARSLAGLRGGGCSVVLEGGLEGAFECPIMHVCVICLCLVHGESWKREEVRPVALGLP